MRQVAHVKHALLAATCLGRQRAVEHGVTEGPGGSCQTHDVVANVLKDFSDRRPEDSVLRGKEGEYMDSSVRACE